MEYKSVFSLFNHIYCFFLLIVVKIVNFVNETIRKGTKKALRMTERLQKCVLYHVITGCFYKMPKRQKKWRAGTRHCDFLLSVNGNF
jgi:hypothetical protein